MIKRLYLFVIFCSLTICSFASQPDLEVPKWSPCNLEFKSTTTPINPFTVGISANITGPKGIAIKLEGFYDGNNTWKIRFSPTIEGKWAITTHSDIPDLNNKQAQVLCVGNDNKNIHGELQIDPVIKHHFIFEDGTRYFPLGYEANWLWAMDEYDNSLPTLNPFLDKLSKYGFNFVLVNAYCYDTKWCLGKTSAEDYGPSSLFPWGGSYQNPDYSHFNLDYWQHFDKVVEALNQRGIGLHFYKS